jgi:acyl-CoA synthetase (AMP-forming)/AMP-acid ligase II
MPGYLYNRLLAAVAEGGPQRTAYSHDTTLSRRGLLARVDRRARELASMGLGRGHVVVLALSHGIEFLVTAMALSKLEAILLPSDPLADERSLTKTADIIPLRAYIGRPHPAAQPLWTNARAGYRASSRKRLTNSLLTVDLWEPPHSLEAPEQLRDTEVVMQTIAPGGTVRTMLRSAEQLHAIGAASAHALALDGESRLFSAQPLSAPQVFDVVVLGWVASAAQLALGEGAGLSTSSGLFANARRLVVFESFEGFVALARECKVSGASLPIDCALADPTLTPGEAKVLRNLGGQAPHQLLFVEEFGILAARALERGAAYEPAHGVRLEAGGKMELGGHEIVVCTPQQSRCIDAVDGPQSPADPFARTGYAGRFSRSGALCDVIGRDDGLVYIEARRICLDGIERAMLAHPRLTWARAQRVFTDDGTPLVQLEYRATGEAAVEDLREFAVGSLAPHMVPRAFVRLESP